MKKFLLLFAAAMICFMAKAADIDFNVTKTLSELGWEQDESVTEINIGDPNIKIVCDKGTASTPPRWYSSSFRMYNLNSISFSVPSGCLIKEIIFTANSSKNGLNAKVNGVAIKPSGTTTTWEGTAQEVKFDVTASCQLLEISVTYSASEAESFTSISDLLSKISQLEDDVVSVECDMTVIYQNEDYHMVTDGTKNMLLKGPDDSDEFAPGTKISKFGGMVSLHETHYELTGVELTKGGAGASIEPMEITSLSEISHKANIYDEILMKGCNISDYNGSNALIEFNGDFVELNNAFNYEGVENRENVNITGFVIRWGNDINIIPINIKGDPVDYKLPYAEVIVPVGESINIPLGGKHPTLIECTSNNTAVAIVDNHGLITAKSIGTAEITVKWNPDATDYFKSGEGKLTVNVIETPQTAVLCHPNKTYDGEITEEFVTISNDDPSYVVDVCAMTHESGSFDNDYRFIAGSDFTFSPALNVTITKIVFKNSLTTGSPVITVNTGDIETTSDRVTTWKGSATSDIVFTTTAQIAVDWFEVYYSVKPLDASKTAVNLTWNETAVEGKYGMPFESPVLSIDNEAARSAVRYMSDNKNVATVDAVTGEVTLVGEGVTLIRAYIPDDNATYTAARTSYKLNVVDATNSVVDATFFTKATNSYLAVSEKDEMGIVYSAVFLAQSENGMKYIQFNTNSNGKGSALVVSNNKRHGVVINSITLKFKASNANGVDIYVQDKDFEAPVKGNDYNLGSATKINSDVIKDNGRIEIGHSAFAIVPNKGAVYIESINVQYSRDKFNCHYDEEELTPQLDEVITLGADGKAVIEHTTSDIPGVELYFKHEANPSTISLMAVEHTGFAKAALTSNEDGSETHTYDGVNGAGTVTYYGFHTTSETKGVERTAEVHAATMTVTNGANSKVYPIPATLSDGVYRTDVTLVKGDALTFNVLGTVYVPSYPSDYKGVITKGNVTYDLVPLADGATAPVFGFIEANSEMGVEVNATAKTVTFSWNTETGVDSIEADEAEAVYYNLQGVRVENPENGIFIEVKNGKAVKVLK